MGNREELLEGAKRCLHERGYARTTARDIVDASGANLASIGYHFGSKDALLDAALIEAIGDLSDRLMQLTAGGNVHLRDSWDRVLAEFDAARPLLVAHAEAWAQIERSPALRERFAQFHAGILARGIDHAKMFRPDLDTDTLHAVSIVSGALADGMIVQSLIDPKQLPTGREIATGLRALADTLDANEPATPNQP